MLKVARVMATALVTVIALTACSPEIKGLSDEDDAPVATTEAPQDLVESDEPSRGGDDPDPIAFALDDCMQVDRSGVGIRFASRVDCAEAHDAQAFFAVVVEDQNLNAIAESCQDELRKAFRDPDRGATYALLSPAGFLYNQGVASNGDEVFCVYVHTEPREGGTVARDE